MADRPILVRVPDDLRERIQTRAKENDRSLSQEVRRTLKREYGSKQPQPAHAQAST